MNSIGVVVFRNQLGKAQVLQESVNNSANILKNDENKTQRREIIIVRKKQKVQSTPATVSVTSLVQAADTGAQSKRPRLRDDGTEETTKAPTPLAVARRNARERNRVRQVNDGFAALRRHIPEEVAEVFETSNSNRGPNKKLSKVETLRMAVEYIRNLESLLNIGHADKENSSRPSMESFPSPASSSPRDLERSYFSLHSPALEEGDIEDEFDGSLLQLPHHQYANIIGPGAFHNMVSTPHLYEDDDIEQALTPSSDLLAQDESAVSPHIIENGFPFANAAEHFTIIDPEDNFNCVENDSQLEHSVPHYEIKYAATLEAQASTNFHQTEELAVEAINPDIMLSQEQFKYKEETPYLNQDNYSELELKKELPDIHVTPEDREQFEETLKWWQEKTRQIRSFVKNNQK